jgi:hypothetical protein
MFSENQVIGRKTIDKEVIDLFGHSSTQIDFHYNLAGPPRLTYLYFGSTTQDT